MASMNFSKFSCFSSLYNPRSDSAIFVYQLQSNRYKFSRLFGRLLPAVAIHNELTVVVCVKWWKALPNERCVYRTRVCVCTMYSRAQTYMPRLLYIVGDLYSFAKDRRMSDLFLPPWSDTSYWAPGCNPVYCSYTVMVILFQNGKVELRFMTEVYFHWTLVHDHVTDGRDKHMTW